MRVIANRQLVGDYGTIAAEQEFECPDNLVGELREKGMVRSIPRIEYQTKVIKPEAPEVGARHPFHDDVSVPDEKPAIVASKGDSMFPAADVSPVGAFDPVGRRGRKGSRPRR